MILKMTLSFLISTGLAVSAMTVPAALLSSTSGTSGLAAPSRDESGLAELTVGMANQLARQTAGTVGDLASRLQSGQSQWLRVAPPTAGFVLNENGGVVVFDPTNFPATLISGLIGDTDYDCPVYSLTLAEDPASRNIVFLNAEGHVIYSMDPEAGYDPCWLLKESYPDLYCGLYSNREIQDLKAMYDPSRIRITVRLLPVGYVQAYAQGMAEERMAVPASRGNAMTPGMMYEGPAVSNLVFTAIEQQTNGMELTLAYPSGFTNRVDLFTCADLIGFWWDLAATLDVNTSQDWMEWLDTNAPPQAVRFYAAGNADLDTDGDGLTDAREQYLYHTSATTQDTDGDGLSDYSEIMTLHTDPNNAKTNKPMVGISYPASGSRKVWLP